MVITMMMLMIGAYFLWQLYQTRSLQPVEKLTYWIVTNIYLKLTFTIFEFNLGLVRMVRSLFYLGVSYISSCFFEAPIITLLVGLLLKNSVHPLCKLLLVAFVSGALSFNDYLMDKGHIVIFQDWRLIFSFYRYLGLILFVFLFARLFRFILITERDRS